MFRLLRKRNIFWDFNLNCAYLPFTPPTSRCAMEKLEDFRVE
jgi:hypothetical protein